MDSNVAKLIAFLLLGILLSGCGHSRNDMQAVLIEPLRADTLAKIGTNSGRTDQNDFRISNVELQAIPASRWQEAYGMFGMSLINEAKKVHLDSVSLSNCLMAVLISPESKGLALLPVAAVSSFQDGQKVWTIQLRWETTSSLMADQPMDHVRAHCFTQNGIKQIGFSTCR